MRQDSYERYRAVVEQGLAEQRALWVAAKHARDDAEGRLVERELALRELDSLLRRDAAGGMEGHRLATISALRQCARREIDEAGRLLQHAEAHLEAASAALREADQKMKTCERVDERMDRERVRMRDRREQTLLDELSARSKK
jgi:flagellar export protein FliJ